MTSISLPAAAIANAFDSFESASTGLLKAVASPDDWTSGPKAMAKMIEAKVQAGASISVIKFSSEMWDALIEMQRV